jgi:hypothetical protein
LGTVSRYMPTRLTEAGLDREVAKISLPKE